MENGINIKQTLNSLSKQNAPYLFTDKVLQLIENKKAERKEIKETTIAVAIALALLTITIILFAIYGVIPMPHIENIKISFSWTKELVDMVTILRSSEFSMGIIITINFIILMCVYTLIDIMLFSKKRSNETKDELV